MVSSRKSRKNDGHGPELPDRVHALLKRCIPRGARITVALSGGIDSVVLCDVLRRVSRRGAWTLRAVHVNHQASPHAADWARFCRRLCRAWKIPLSVVKVEVARSRGSGGFEAAARAARLRVYASLRTDAVALAHHLDDQAETLMLQLLRGVGVKGVSAMPMLRYLGRDAHAIALVRPLLELPRSAIESYARARRLEWIDDESNADTNYDRNFLRHEALPVIARRYPAYRETLARASGHFAESADLLDQLAQIDLSDAAHANVLPLACLRALSPARACNALRCWLRARGAMLPNSARLEECVRQARLAHAGAGLVLRLEGGELRAYRDAFWLLPPQSAVPPTFRARWRGEPRLALPLLGGSLIMRRYRGHGISLARLQSAAVTVRVRQGGERLRPAAGRPRRSLKQLMQEAGMPPWQRERLPLLYCGDVLVYAPGIGMDCNFKAMHGEASVEPAWATHD